MTEPLFDPNAVERYEHQGMYECEGMRETADGDWVQHDDYSKLLSLYRELQERERVES